LFRNTGILPQATQTETIKKSNHLPMKLSHAAPDRKRYLFRALLSLFIHFTYTQTMQAQTIVPFKPGEYYLEGVREVGSGLRFNADNTFDFFFSYGAVDRIAAGTWHQKGDRLILEGPPKPEKDFVLVNSKKSGGRQLTIRITNPNRNYLSGIYCIIETAAGQLEGRSDQDGLIVIETTGVKQFNLVHSYFPDRLSTYDVQDLSHNYFEFTIDPHIADVEFKNISLKIGRKSLEGPHPLLQGDALTYVRAE
jgi:hypothetical protein